MNTTRGVRGQGNVVVGDVYGRLTAERFVGGERALWLCRCACGNLKTALANNLRRGLTASCGCLHKERSSAASRTHGMSQTKLYSTWSKIRRRCENPADRAYMHYGGRGIRVHPAWKDLGAFIRDVGAPPSPLHTLDRVDNDGHYEPGNVRWATRKEQMRNRRNTRYGTAWGVKKPLSVWAEERGMSLSTLYRRIDVEGMPLEIALTTPTDEASKRLRNPRTVLLTFNGETRPLGEWARVVGVSDSTLRGRMRSGWSVEHALTTPLRPQRHRRPKPT